MEGWKLKSEKTIIMGGNNGHKQVMKKRKDGLRTEERYPRITAATVLGTSHTVISTHFTALLAQSGHGNIKPLFFIFWIFVAEVFFRRPLFARFCLVLAKWH